MKPNFTVCQGCELWDDINGCWGDVKECLGCERNNEKECKKIDEED